MKTKNKVIELVKSEFQNNNTLVIATLGNGGSGLDLMQNQDKDFINDFIVELEGYSFDGLVDACDDIKESEYYNEDCEVYQFSDNDGYKLQVLIFNESVMRTDLIKSIDFTKEEYDEKVSGEGLETFDRFIDNILSSTEENSGDLEDAIFMANDAFKQL